MFSIDISNPHFPGEDVYESIIIRDEESLQGFDASITAILLKPGPLKTLRIYIAFDDVDTATVGVPYIRNWMERVINRGVENIDLKCFTLENGQFDTVVLPVELIQYEILVDPNLYGIVIRNFVVPQFPLLKNINLTEVDFEDSSCFISLLNACPNLLNLISNATNFDTVQILTLTECSNMLLSKLCTANLRLTFCHLPICAFSNVQDLEIELNKVCKERDPIPSFNNLTNLKLSSVNSNWRLLLRFFNCCPKLRTLELNEGIASEDRDFVPQDWVDPEEEPYCIHSMLTDCTFIYF